MILHSCVKGLGTSTEVEEEEELAVVVTLFSCCWGDMMVCSGRLHSLFSAKEQEIRTTAEERHTIYVQCPPPRDDRNEVCPIPE